MVRAVAHFIVVLILAEIAAAFIFNETGIDELDNALKVVQTRRQDKKKKSESTSSDGKRRSGETGGSGDSSESLGQSFSGHTSTDTDEKKRTKKKDRTPKSSADRKGWRKWHRKCTRCPEDMHKKWRDPTIKWICGAYQRARRTFKSLCMMHYRNCQDGTMFTKIADHRCPNASGPIHPHGEHFFYDYHVVLTDDDTDSGEEISSSPTSSSSWDSSAVARLPPLHL